MRATPICPKCGYDQSGEIATWETQCPIDGQCPECGHQFQWAEPFRILSEWGSEVKWYAEHAHNHWEMIDRTPGTLLRLALPFVFFRGVNLRRDIRIKVLALWMIFLTIALHLLVSPIGYAAHRAEGYAHRARGGNGAIADFIEVQLTEIPSAVLYPFLFFEFNHGDGHLRTGPFAGYEWEEYMPLGWVIVGASLFWVGVVGFVLLVRHAEQGGTRRDLRQLARVFMLGLLPAVIYVQWVRLGFGIHATTGMTSATEWVPISILIVLLLCLFWQQLLWTRAVREIWVIRRSFFINVIGCFASVIFGVVFLFMMV